MRSNHPEIVATRRVSLEIPRFLSNDNVFSTLSLNFYFLSEYSVCKNHANKSKRNYFINIGYLQNCCVELYVAI